MRSQRCEPKDKPKGLINYGNTCYMNASLQALVCVREFRKLLSSKIQSSAPTNLLEAFRWLYNLLYCSTATRSVGPKYFFTNITKISPSMDQFNQQDANEFICCVLDKLEHEFPKEANPIKGIFEGALESVVCCRRCGDKSSSTTPVSGLLLDVVKEERTVQKCLDTTMNKQEELVGRRCPSCKSTTDSYKVAHVKTPPNALVLTLQRFQYNHYGHQSKNNAKVQPTLRLTLHTSGGHAVTYLLRSIVCHHGYSLNYGHYYAYVRAKSSWYLCDDDCVVAEPISRIMADESSYMFIYELERQRVRFPKCLTCLRNRIPSRSARRHSLMASMCRSAAH